MLPRKKWNVDMGYWAFAVPTRGGILVAALILKFWLANQN